jgi:hypothetical protein
MMKKLHYFIAVVIILLIAGPFKPVNGQGGCIEIKSILVDACGTPEGENEMVRFDVGPNPLNVSNMIVDWPNNSWQGLCQDAGTAAIVTNINGLIQGCGSVTEPTGGVLPANSKILLMTSLNVNTILNSFANLNEDLIILFQCNGNTSGHFANFSLTPGLRTLSVEFTGAGGCVDSVTYDRTMLVNQFGVTGGFTFENDGSFVEFDAAGNPTYLNYGCQVLSAGLSLTAGPDVGICPGATQTATLNGAGVNVIGNPQWTGGTGSFNPNNAFSTVYTPGPGETGIVYLSLTGNGACNTSITDTVRVNIVPSLPAVSISASVSGVFYSSITDSIYFYNWYPDGSSTFIPGAFNPTFTPSSNGCYYMILSTVGGCTVQSNTICITNVGLSENNAQAQLLVRNNPGTEPWFTLESTSAIQKVSMEIMDIYGRIVLEQDLKPSSTILEVHPEWTGIAQGMYVARFRTDNFIIDEPVILTK